MAVMKERLDAQLVTQRADRAAALRTRLFPDPAITNGYRLLNGEGDGLPGLVCDVYADRAVLKLDGAGPQAFYSVDGVARWLRQRLPHLKTVYLKVCLP
jgi:23S rRNA (cytosine1962-C5)-methyltransferase